MEIEIKKELTMTISIGSKELHEIIQEYDGDVESWLEDIEFDADDIETEHKGVRKLQKYIDIYKDNMDKCEICGKDVGYDNLKELSNARHNTGKKVCDECKIKNEDSKNQLYFNMEKYYAKKTA